jgi:hypothetical protein
MTKLITKRVSKECNVCGKTAHVKIYNDHSYRGGHYFGKVPFYSEKALNESFKAGSHESKILGRSFQVMNKSPIPYKFEEYWECPKCYWGSWPKIKPPSKTPPKAGLLL